ncbi:hypothetical protein ACQI4L_11270 [Mycolicibacterium litorale]|uniref:hypothetical protein n=1 Tax=Mycolicibacterium litorale TaxID=758802 RepID=UPI003CF03E7C
MPWQTLGLPETVDILTANSSQDFSLPVPQGSRPQRLRGRIDLPVDSPPGYLEIQDGQGRFLAAVDLPPAGVARSTVPLDADISAAPVTGSSVKLSLTVRQTDDDLRCRPRQQITVSDLSTVFAGAETAPTTVATFFPPVLERVNIYTPADADQSEQQAVLALTSALARSYSPQRVAITVLTLPRGAVPPVAGERSRAVVVEKGSAELTVARPGGPEAYLRVSGRGDELTRQVSLIKDGLQALAQVPSVRIDQAAAVSERDSDTRTFRDLNMDGNAEVLGAGNLTVGVDRAALTSGRVESVQVHLLGDYTPVGPDDSATLSVVVNGDAYHTQALDGSGRVDATFDLPAAALTQRINLDLALTYTPHLPCSRLTAPLRFWLDPESTLTIRRGGAPSGDFASLPSEFSPEFLVAFDGSGPDQLDYAARVIGSLARLTTVSLSPRVVDLAAAVDSGTSALIVARPKALEQSALQLPVGGDGSVIDVDLPTQLRADVERGLGSIQAFADRPNDRTIVLVSTTAAWSLVPPVLDHLGGLPGGWAALTGNVLAAGAQGIPTDMSIPVGIPEPAPEQSQGWALWAGLGALIVVLAALGVGGWLRRRRGKA